MSAPERFIGIDVSKGWLDVAQVPDGRSWRVANDETGWAELVSAVAAGPATLVVLEATGGYELGLVTALDLAGHPPVVANPVSTRRFAQSLGRRAKTDRVDALMLAQYGERMRPTPRPLPEETARALQELLVRHQQLTKMLVEEKNRRQQVTVAVRPSVDAHIAFLEQQRSALERLRERLVASDPTWQERVNRLDSVPGFGKELAALVGVAPYARESGLTRGQRHVSGGRSRLRHELYEAMMSTIRWDPTMKAHFDHLRARGKPYKVAMVACMRRLLGILNVMMRKRLTWQETKVGQGHFLAAST